MAHSNLTKKLLKAYGDRCCHCHKKMLIPNYGQSDIRGGTHPDAVSIEHHFQKLKKSKLIIHLRLAHRKCNL